MNHILNKHNIYQYFSLTQLQVYCFKTNETERSDFESRNLDPHENRVNNNIIMILSYFTGVLVRYLVTGMSNNGGDIWEGRKDFGQKRVRSKNDWHSKHKSTVLACNRYLIYQGCFLNRSSYTVHTLHCRMNVALSLLIFGFFS